MAYGILWSPGSVLQVQQVQKETEERRVLKVTGVLWGRRAMQELDLCLAAVQN